VPGREEGHPALADDDRAGRDELAVAALTPSRWPTLSRPFLTLPPAFL
jgi:hypothetical protein